MTPELQQALAEFIRDYGKWIAIGVFWWLVTR